MEPAPDDASDEQAFQRFFRESFPAVSAESRAKIRSYLARHQTDLKWLYAQRSRVDHLVQGDLFGFLPAYFVDRTEVRQSREPCPIMLLEHTCDMSFDSGQPRTSHYVYAPLLPFEQITDEFDTTALEKNFITHKMNMGMIPTLNEHYVADLNMLGSVAARSFHEAVDDGEVNKIISLSHNGLHFLLTKLTVHFLRFDDSVDHPERAPS